MPNTKLTYEQHCQLLKDLKTMSYKEIMYKYNICEVTVRNLKNRKPNKNKYMGDLNLKHDFFSKLTEESAYWAGFIAGDGSISKKRHNIKIRLNIKDDQHINKFIEAVNTSNKKYYYKKCRVGKYWNNPASQICVYSKQMLNDLKLYGIGPCKSFTLKFPNNLPKNMVNHFIRGIFDADGCISYHRIINKVYPMFVFVGTHSICKNIAKYLNIHNKIGWNKSIRYIQIKGTKQVNLIYDYLYKNATVYLDRKKARFEELLGTSN
jgi:intein/homing endonuclease